MILRESIGIAVGDSQLTLAYMKATPLGIKMVAHETHSSAAGGDRHARSDEIHGHVQTFMNRHGIRNACVFLGLPANLGILRMIQLPLAAKENLRQAIGYELKKIIPLPADDISFDYQILGENKTAKRMEILLAAVKKSDLSPYSDPRTVLAKSLGGIETTATAWINGMPWTGSGSDPSAHLAVLIEPQTCQLVLLLGGQIKHICTLQLHAGTNEMAGQILDAAQAIVAAGNLSQGPMNFYCLGAGVTDNLIDALRIAQRWTVQVVKLPDGTTPDRQLLAAAGLAAKGIQPVTLELNHLPPSARKRPSRAGQFLTAGLAVLVLLSALGWIGSAFFYRRAIDSNVDRQIAQLSEEVRTIDRLQTEIELLRQQVDYIRGLQPVPGTDTLGILDELSKIIPKTAWLRDLNINGKKVQMDGFADDAAHLIPLLDQSPLLTNVIFLSAITKGRDGKERFRIGFDVVTP